MAHRNGPRPAFDARMMIHLQLTLILAWLGFVLLLPGDTFDGSQVWKYFTPIATENEWAGIFLVCSALGGLGIDTARWWLKLSSILMLSTVHGMLALLFLRGNPYGGASGTFAIVALSGYYLAWRQTWGLI